MSIIGVSKTDLVEEFADAIRIGLSKEKKSIDPKYLYDSEGSRLFDEICKLDEYYLTRKELSIIREQIDDILSSRYSSIVELGSGNASKTRYFIEHLLSKQDRLYYMPIDISHSALKDAIDNLSIYNNLEVIGITSDYVNGLNIADKIISKSRIDSKLILFLGSSIGNLEPSYAINFLRMVKEHMSKQDRLLIGFDLKKDKSILELAYNDRKGITAKFNLNLLARINRELKGRFDIARFEHKAFYNASRSRIEMHIVSREEQEVYIEYLDLSVKFKERDSIHTENSYKFSIDDIDRLARKAELEVEEHYMDKDRWFVLTMFKAC